MNGFNSIDPTFGKGSSKRLSDGISSNASSNHSMGSPRTAQLATIGKSDWQRTHANKLDSNKVEIIYTSTGGYSYGNETTRIVDPSLQYGEGKKIENSSVADNAGNYHERNSSWKVEMRDEAPFSPRKKKNYHTEKISCTLNDLVLGLKSPVIQLAVSKMEEEGSQCNSRSSASSSPLPFEFIVDEQKKLTRNYNTGAKEFIPAYYRQSL